MQSLRETQASARRRIGELEREMADTEPNTPTYRAAASKLRVYEDDHRSVLAHDFTKLHNTVMLDIKSETARLYLQCVLALLRKWIPQLELDFVDRRGATLSDAIGDGRHAGVVRRELENDDAEV